MGLDWAIDGWIIAVGALCAAACAVPGTLLVVRAQGMLGDAIAHAVLPGIAAGFLWSHTREGPWMFLGAIVSAVLAAVMTVLLERWGRLERGAAMGVVLSAFFALGLIVLVQAADAVDLDPGCVLYGSIELTPIDTTVIGGITAPRTAWMLGVIALANAALAGLLAKELRIAAFDPAMARAVGSRPLLMDLLLAAMTAVTAVACFDAIGSVLFVALLVAPAAGARMLTERLWRMVPLAMLLGAAAAILGHVAAIGLPSMLFRDISDTSSTGMIAFVSGLVFAACALINRLRRHSQPLNTPAAAGR